MYIEKPRGLCSRFRPLRYETNEFLLLDGRQLRTPAPYAAILARQL